MELLNVQWHESGGCANAAAKGDCAVIARPQDILTSSSTSYGSNAEVVGDSSNISISVNGEPVSVPPSINQDNTQLLTINDPAF